jgi:hypothetical protein
MEESDTSSAGVHAKWLERFFAPLVDGYLIASGTRGGRVGNAWSYFLPARELLGFARPVMERVAIDRGATSDLLAPIDGVGRANPTDET